MASKYPINLTFTNGDELNVEVGFQDMLRWETNHRGEPWLNGGMPSFTKLLETAYYSGRRTGEVTEKHFDQWKKTVADLDASNTDEDFGYDEPESGEQDESEARDEEATFQ